MNQRRQRIEIFEEEIEAFMYNVREADAAPRHYTTQIIEPLASCDPSRRTREGVCSSASPKCFVYGKGR